jgi:hypothetical protein
MAKKVVGDRSKSAKPAHRNIKGTVGNGSERLGTGGEIHQTSNGDIPVLTTQQGVPVSDDQNSLKIGARGPTALEDFHFREKIFHFDHERIPERVVHARGFGAHGYFENYQPLTDFTRADLFQRAREKTPAFVRFSTVAGNKGSPDLARDVRGFAVKLYTREGNWDIVGNNIPVFFIQDAIKFPDLIHAAKQEPDRGFPQAQTAHDNFWDFISLMPESVHMAMWIMSDRAIPPTSRQRAISSQTHTRIRSSSVTAKKRSRSCLRYWVPTDSIVVSSLSAAPKTPSISSRSAGNYVFGIGQTVIFYRMSQLNDPELCRRRAKRFIRVSRSCWLRLRTSRQWLSNLRPSEGWVVVVRR